MVAVKPRAATWTFLGLLGAQLVGLAVQAPGRKPGEANLLESLGLAVLGPLGRGVQAAVEPVAAAIDHGLLLATARDEVLALRQQVARLEKDRLRLSQLEEEVESLSRLLAYERGQPRETRLGVILHFDLDSAVRSLVVDTGSWEARSGLPVLDARGIVGRVTVARGRYAKVQLLTDVAFHVAVELSGSRRQGIARGDGRRGLILDYVSRQVPVELGERVTTAGIDGIFPPGLPVGEVVGVAPGSELFHEIQVRPHADLLRLRHVLISEAEPWTTVLGSDTGR